MKPVKLSTFLSKQKLLGLCKKKKEYEVYQVDDTTRVLVRGGNSVSPRSIDEFPQIRIVTTNKELVVRDYFSQLDIEMHTYSFLCKRESSRDVTSISLKGVTFPQQYMLYIMDAKNINFGDDINLVEQLGYGMHLPSLRNTSKLVFNKSKSSKLMTYTGFMKKISKYSTKDLGVNTLCLDCLVIFMGNSLGYVKTLDLSSISTIVEPMRNLKSLSTWGDMLKKVYVSREIAYIVVQLITGSMVLNKYLIKTLSKYDNIYYNKTLVSNKYGVKQLSYCVDENIADKEKLCESREIVMITESEAKKNYELLLKNKSVRITSTIHSDIYTDVILED